MERTGNQKLTLKSSSIEYFLFTAKKLLQILSYVLETNLSLIDNNSWEIMSIIWTIAQYPEFTTLIDSIDFTKKDKKNKEWAVNLPKIVVWGYKQNKIDNKIWIR
jgi:hypothetical protein